MVITVLMRCIHPRPKKSRDSTAVLAIAYDAEPGVIYVRFRSGAEWRYLACTPAEWAQLADPRVSKGRYVNDVLKRKPAERMA